MYVTAKTQDIQWWDKRIKDYRDILEIEIFVVDKLKDLSVYDKVKERVGYYGVFMGNGEMTAKDFISEIDNYYNIFFK